mgnify:CR=1 FL=1
MSLTYQQIHNVLGASLPVGHQASILDSALGDRGPWPGSIQIARSLDYSDIPALSDPEPGKYLWCNNPENIKESNEPQYLMSLPVSGGNDVRDFGINVAAAAAGGVPRSVYAFFLPPTQAPRSAFSIEFLTSSGTPKGIVVMDYNNALKAGRAALKEYYSSDPASFGVNKLVGAWRYFNLGSLTHSSGSLRALLTGLVKIRFAVAGHFVISVQPTSANPAPPSLPVTLVECEKDGAICMRRSCGVYAQRQCALNLNGEVILPDPDAHPSTVSMDYIRYFTHHEDQDSPINGTDASLDLDWVSPIHPMPGDPLRDMIEPSACDLRRWAPKQFQGNYQVAQTLRARLVNNYTKPSKVILVAYPKLPLNSPPIAFHDLINNTSIPLNAVFGASRVEGRCDVIKIKTFEIPSCSLYDIQHTVALANGCTGRYYYALVPFVQGTGSAGTEPEAAQCTSTSASTVSTKPSTTMTLYTSSGTSGTSGTTTGSTTGTGGTPNTNITPDTGVTPYSGTNSGSGTPVSSGTGTPITMVTNDTPVTPGPG